MKAQCVPQNQIPHTTRLFSDFLACSPSVRQFYPRSPHFGDWFRAEATQIRYDVDRRRQVADILERQNRNWGASPKTLHNIARLRGGACTLVTGQQVGLFGGPLFSIFKALTAVKLADEASSAGVECVPVFWLATQDHDLEEIHRVAMPRQDFSLQTLTATTQAGTDAPVGSIAFGGEIEPLVNQAAELLGDSEATTFLRESYRPGETFGSAFARLFTRLFANWGVILLDAADPAVNHVAQPIYQAAVEHAVDLNQKLLARDRELEQAGYHQQVKVTPASTLLFALQNGARTPVHQLIRNGQALPDFSIGQERISRQELLRRIAARPEDFSANVLLRPIKQDYLLPTLAYTGGAAEVAYFAQIDPLYRFYQRPAPVIWPRAGFTILDKEASESLQRHALGLEDCFRGKNHVVRKILLAEPGRAGVLLAGMRQRIDQEFDEMKPSLASMDVSLGASAETIRRKLLHRVASLHSKFVSFEVRRNASLDREVSHLLDCCYPNSNLQERELGVHSLLARHGLSLLDTLYDCIDPEILAHRIVRVP